MGMPKKVLIVVPLIIIYTFILFIYDPEPSSIPKMMNVRVEAQKQRYILNSSACKLIDHSIYHPSVENFIPDEPKKLNCSSLQPLTYSEGTTLFLDLNLLDQYNLTASEVRCYYQGIVRVTQTPEEMNGDCDKISKMKLYIEIKRHKTLISDDGILVYCNKAVNETIIPKKFDVNKNITFYTNVHHFIQPFKAYSKMKKFEESGGRESNEDKLSVMMVGIDSVSRLNLIRSFPKTYKYITEEMDAIILKGYNKVEDNTFVNMVPMLMGLSVKELEDINCPDLKTKVFDDCPIIWKDYYKNGYTTLFAEDAVWMGIFKYTKRGFQYPPAIYYLHPSFILSEKYIGHNAGNKGLNGKVCQGPTGSLEVLYDYLYSSAETLKDTPYFSLVHSAALTHDYISLSSAGDEPSYSFFNKLNTNQLLNNTIVVFYSDHGLRFGGIRKTYIGFIEERTPFVAMIFPKWFQEKYPEMWSNLKTNQNRLTCNYDIYHTLKDILNQNFKFQNFDDPKNKTYGRTLFKEIPINRTCSDCNINPSYCACENSIDLNIDKSKFNKHAEKMVNTLNKKLKSHQDCAKLILDKIIAVRASHSLNIKSSKKETTSEDDKKEETFYILLKTNPGGGEFEGTVADTPDNGLKVISDISRINKYGNQSHCITHDVNRKYCYCKDLL